MVHHLWRKAFLATVLMLSLTAIPAGAVTCSGSGCTGQSPVSTGCVDDAVWVTAAPLLYGNGYWSAGQVQLMWSPTCETVWSRVSTYDPQTYDGESYSHWAWMAKSPFTFEAVTTTGAPPTPDDPTDYDDYDEVVDPVSMQRHLEGTMRHRSNSFVANGVKACGRITGLVPNTCTVQVYPNTF